MVENKNYFLEIQNKLDTVFDIYEHVKGKEERDITEDEVYGLMIALVHQLLQTPFNNIEKGGLEH